MAHHDFEKGLNSRAFFKVHDHALGEDLVQNTFMKTWSYLVKGGKIDIMRAFLYHVLNNLIVDEYRKHKTTSLDVLVEKGFEPKDIHPENLLNALDGKAAREGILVRLSHNQTDGIIDLMEAFALSEKDVEKIMRMKYIQDLSLKEMSLITGQTKNAMAVQLYRGLEKLKILYNHL